MTSPPSAPPGSHPSPRIILVEPAGPLNLGSVARVMKNFGLHDLILVNPQCDRLCDDALKMAVHARDVLEQAQIVANLPEALQGIQRAIATTGVAHGDLRPLEFPRQVLPWLTADPGSTSAIIFGREDRGLSVAELHYAQRWLQIPSHAAYPSLNLAQAVAICCYELATLQPQPPDTPTEPESAPLEQLEGYYQHLETLLLQIGYLYPHTATSRMKRLRRLYQRAQPTEQEIQMLRGILSQVTWATKGKV